MVLANIRLAYMQPQTGATLAYMDLPLDKQVGSSPYVLKSADGLGPPDINVAISGNVYQGRSVTNREVSLILGYRPNYGLNQTAGDLRRELNQWLTPRFDLPITLMLQDKNRVTYASVECYGKRIEADPFTKETQAQLVLSCVGPYFKDHGRVVPNPTTIGKNPILVPNPGDAPSGFSMRLALTGAVNFFWVFDTVGANVFWINYKFLNGDVISFDTTKGKRKASVKRGSVTTNLLPFQSSDSKWIQLHEGINGIGPSTQNFTLQEVVVNANYWGV